MTIRLPTKAYPNTALGHERHEQLGGCRNSGTTDGEWTWCNMSNRATANVGAGEHTVEVRVKCDPAHASLRSLRVPLTTCHLPHNTEVEPV